MFCVAFPNAILFRLGGERSFPWQYGNPWQCVDAPWERWSSNAGLTLHPAESSSAIKLSAQLLQTLLKGYSRIWCSGNFKHWL